MLEGHYFRGKHHSMLANLFDLESITVDDVMTPRNQIEAIDLTAKASLLSQQLVTSYHTRLPAFEDGMDNIVGIIHLKQVLRLEHAGELDGEHLRTILRAPYYVPAGTPLLTQLHQFQVDRQRLGLVVDEYGELQGLVTIEDIVEEIVGDIKDEHDAVATGVRCATRGSWCGSPARPTSSRRASSGKSSRPGIQ